MAGLNFPNGMKELGDMIHKKGLKYGLCECRRDFVSLPWLSLNPLAEASLSFPEFSDCFAQP